MKWNSSFSSPSFCSISSAYDLSQIVGPQKCFLTFCFFFHFLNFHFTSVLRSHLLTAGLCFPTVQEPVKSRAPQLHLEYRFYKTLGTTGRVPELPLLLLFIFMCLAWWMMLIWLLWKIDLGDCNISKTSDYCTTVTGPKKSCIPKTQVLIFRT